MTATRSPTCTAARSRGNVRGNLARAMENERQGRALDDELAAAMQAYGRIYQ